MRLWTYLATALERAGCPLGTDLAAFVAANAGEIETRVLPRLVNALAAVPDDVVIVLDDFHFVREQACHDQVGFLVDHLPPQCHLVIATRADPGLRSGGCGQWPARRDACSRSRLQRRRGDRSADAAGGPTVQSAWSRSWWSTRRAGRPVSTWLHCRCREGGPDG